MLYDATVPQFVKLLANLSAMLDLGAAYAESKKANVENLLTARLAVDQFNLLKQVQVACDNAKYSVSRLTGKDAPKHEDDEKTLPELKARIQSVIDYLNTFTPQDFAGAEERRISLPRWEGRWMTGREYAIQYAVPNVTFHVATAYAILRHNGVDLGKKHFLGALPLKS